MRLNLTLFLFLIAMPWLMAQVTISGTVRSYNNDYITIEKASSYELLANPDTIHLYSPSFEYNLYVSESTLFHVDFHHPEKPRLKKRIALFANPGDTIRLDIDFSRTDESGERINCQFMGSNAAGHQMYYSSASFSGTYHTERLKEIIRNSQNVSISYVQFARELNALLDPYRILLIESKIDNKYYQIVTTEIKTRILSSILNGLVWEKDGLVELLKDKREILRLLIMFLNNCPEFEEVPLLAGTQFISLTTFFNVNKFVRKGIVIYPDFPDTIVSFAGQEFQLENFIASGLSIENDTLQEFYLAYWLHFYYQTMLGMMDQYNEEFAYFKARYPNSRYIPILEEERIRNPQHLADYSKEKGKSVTGLENSKYFPEWEPVLIDEGRFMENFRYNHDTVYFDEGIYYVDIWATWYRPCLVEMTNNYRADSLLAANHIRRLYISIDKPEDVEKWKSTVFDLHLGGYHVMANEELNVLLQKQLGSSSKGSLLIPRYLFIKDGEIVNKFAARPGHFKRLEKQVVGLVKQEQQY